MPSHQEQCEKKTVPFSLVNLAGSQAGTVTPGRSGAPSCPSWGNEGWAPSFHFLPLPLLSPAAMSPAQRGGMSTLPGQAVGTGSSEGWQGVPSELPISGLSGKQWLAEEHTLGHSISSLPPTSPQKCLLTEHQGCPKVVSS